MGYLWDRFQEALESGQVVPGDAIAIKYRSRNWLTSPVQWGIEHVQVRALLDLLGDFEEPGSDAEYAFRWAAGFSHLGMVHDAGRTVEMTSPKARLYPWDKRLDGVEELAVVRPVGAMDREGNPDRVALRRAATEGYEDVLHERRYPYREILSYWFLSWGQKLWLNRKFADVFSQRENVCSGSVLAWWQRAEIPMDLAGYDTRPEAWYPGRFLVDGKVFRTVFCAKV